MLYLFTELELHTSLMLVLTLIFILVYEAINGFHDTANAVTTIIYTRAMRSQIAVVMSGVFNFLGVLMGGLSVAYAIVHLLSTDFLLNVSSTHNLAMLFSMLLAAILWNLGTWYFGLPASSSHTLIGTIIGIGLTNAFLSNNLVAQTLNIHKLIEIFLSLIISPLVGLILAGSMVLFLHRYWSSTKKRRRIHLTPIEREKRDGKRKPPFWTRIALIFSAAGVSFSHGANDGQKGIGLIMLMLIGVAPAGFVVNMKASSYDISRTSNAVNHLKKYYAQHPIALTYINSLNEISGLSTVNKKMQDLEIASKSQICHCDSSQVLFIINRASLILGNLENYEMLSNDQRLLIRHLLICIADTTDKLLKFPELSAKDKRFLANLRHDLLYTIEYAPIWIIIAVAISLALGTMIGWRRVVTTIGEKIGKKSMTYAQGLSAQLTAAMSIGIASYTGMPVSTTHVLSSAVTGAMIAEGGIQIRTLKNILLTWILTLPAAIVLTASFYLLVLKMI